jgi:hypothetical protein
MVCTDNDQIMVILHNGWELHSWEMSHSHQEESAGARWVKIVKCEYLMT